MNAVADALLEEEPVDQWQISPVSVEEYQRMGEYNENGKRIELLRGVVVEKMPRSDLHLALVRELYELARAAVGPGQFVTKEDPLMLADSEPEPDVAVIAGHSDDYRHHKPRTALFAVEVAINTVGRDRQKVDIYAEAGVPEYWLVLPKRAEVEVYRSPRDGRYTERRVFTAADGGTLVSTAVPALRLDLAAFFV